MGGAHLWSSDERAALRALAVQGGRAALWRLSFDLRSSAGEASRNLPALLPHLVELGLLQGPLAGELGYELTQHGGESVDRQS